MKRNLFYSLFAAIVAIFLPSCNSSSDDIVTEEYQYDIATLSAMNDNGSSYIVQKDAASLPVTLTTTQRIDTTNVKVGERLLIVYSLPNGVSAYTSSSITLQGYRPIINKPIEFGSFSGQNDNLRLISAWVTGKYLNVYASGAVYSDPKEFKLIVDENTLSDQYPTVYLVFRTDNEMSAVESSIYASFDISELQSKASGFQLVWNPIGSVSGKEVFDFSGMNTIQPIL